MEVSGNDDDEEVIRNLLSKPCIVHKTRRQRTVKAFKVKAPPVKLKVNVKTVFSGYFLGFEDLISDRNYTTTVRCISSTGSLYEIGKKDFNAKLMRIDPFQKQLRKQIVAREQEIKAQIKIAEK